MKSADGTSPLSPGCAAALRHAKNAHGRSTAEPRGPCSGGRYAGLHLTRLSGNNAQSVLILSSAVPVFIKQYVLGATLSKLYPIPMRRVKRRMQTTTRIEKEDDEKGEPAIDTLTRKAGKEAVDKKTAK